MNALQYEQTEDPAVIKEFVTINGVIFPKITVTGGPLVTYSSVSPGVWWFDTSTSTLLVRDKTNTMWIQVKT
jgi:hypothetical protein